METDFDEMVEVMYSEPSLEQIAFSPSIAGAREFSRVLWRLAGPDQFAVAEHEGRIVGFAWWSHDVVSMRMGARAAVAGWGFTGPIRLFVRGVPRQFVELTMPSGPKLLELQTHPGHRGKGIGASLLQYVIDAAGDQPLSLTTRSDNPARRLYERSGFTVTAEKRHPAFEKRTGSPGRILMVRPG